LWLLLVTGTGGVPLEPRAVPEPPREIPEPPREVPEPPREVPEPRAVSDAELRELSEQLLAADSNRAGPGQLELNLQGSGRLFARVSPSLLAVPTVSALLALLDNYEQRPGRAEAEPPEELREQQRFLEAALATPVLALLERFVLHKGLYPSAEAFRADLHSMWFGLYSRSGGKVLDSCGFEHVFVGE
ncbi:ENDUC protein, partial [Agelaius phoeniceus]|nr:ENDUC protein [Agelaius phoeniceus]